MNMSEELERLRALHERGALSDGEYTAAKARIIGAGAAAGSGVDNSVGATAATALHRLRRSQSDRWLGGVCGGLGLQLGIPSWVLRLGFFLLAFCFGTGILLYIALWVFVPEEPASA